MNNLKEIVDRFNFHIRSYQELKNIKIIDTDQGKYVVKNKTLKQDNLYEYLTSKNFNNIIEKEIYKDYELSPYIEEVSLPKEEKAIELVYLLSLLHNKTTFYREISLDKVKEVYETLTKEVEYLTYYYHDLQDSIEQKVYMAPEEYLLMRNISIIYSSLYYAKENLDKWYEYKNTKKKERVVLLHGRPSMDHLLIGENRCLISWSHAKRDIPIYDFIYFYKHEYLDLEMSTLFDIYQSKFTYTKDELLLFFTIISIPKKIVFTKKHYKDSIEVFKLVKYIEKTRDFILKKDEETKKENNYEFDK